MKVPYELSIDSFKKEDTAELFNAVCERVLNIHPREAKKNVLHLKGSLKELDEFMPTLTSLYTLVTHFDIKVELKVIYMAEEKVEVEKPFKKHIEKQETEITNPELQEEKKPVILKETVPEVKSPTIDPPDFD